MKKLLPLSAVLLTAALFFTACTQPVNSATEANPGPGNWRDMTTADHYITFTPRNGRTVTVTGNTVSFAGNKNELDAADKPTSGFTYWPYSFTNGTNNFTGFTASAQGSSTESGCGLIFCGTDIANNNYDGYILLLNNGGFKVIKRSGGINSTMSNGYNGWVTADYIKADPQGNEVTDYKENANNIIKINNNPAFTILNAEYTSGWIGFTTNIGAEDTQVQQQYTFKKVQY